MADGLESLALDAGDDDGDGNRVLEAVVLAWVARPGSDPHAAANTAPSRMAATNPFDLIE